MFDPLSLHRLARLRHQELLAEAEAQRRLSKRASHLDSQAGNRESFASWLEALHKQLKTRFSN